MSRVLVPAIGAGVAIRYEVSGGPPFPGALLSVAASLLASATVATRTAVLRIVDRSGNTVAEFPGSFAHTNNLERTYVFGGTGTAYENGAVVSVPMQIDFGMEEGDVITLDVVNIQAGDIWSDMVLVFS